MNEDGNQLTKSGLNLLAEVGVELVSSMLCV